MLFFFNINTYWTVRHCSLITIRAKCLHTFMNNRLLLFLNLLILLLCLSFLSMGTVNIHQTLNQRWYSKVSTLWKNLKIFCLKHILITTFWHKSIKLYRLLFNTNPKHFIIFLLINFNLKSFWILINLNWLYFFIHGFHDFVNLWF